jgi:hypothetical protein
MTKISFKSLFENLTDREEIIKQICESIVRHMSNDFILNTLANMKRNGDSEEKRFKWFVRTCYSYGCGDSDYSFECLKSVSITKPFVQELKWKEVYDRVKDLPFKKWELTLKLKVVDSGFDVINSNDFDKVEGIQRIVHIPNKMTNDKIGVSKDEFEQICKMSYGTTKAVWVDEAVALFDVIYKGTTLRVLTEKEQNEYKSSNNITGKIHECYVDVFNYFNGDKQKADDYAKQKGMLNEE